MTRKLLKAAGSARKTALLELLKKTPGGLSAKAVAGHLGMTPTGARDVCESLKKSGLLTTWRNPVPRGRPERLYRLTEKAAEFFDFPEAGLLPGILEAAAGLFGSTAPGKIAFRYFQQKTGAARKRIRGESTAERLSAIARWRSAEGFLSVFEDGPPPCIVEYHDPLRPLFELVPDARTMETRMLSELAGAELCRVEKKVRGQCEIRFF